MVRSLIARVLQRHAGGAGLFAPAAARARVQPTGFVVLTPGPVPTADYYLLQRLRRCCPDLPLRVIDTLVAVGDEPAPDAGSTVFIVRHAPVSWLRWLETHRARPGRVIYLLDDDIPAALQARELPFRYALRTAWRFARARRRLAPLCDEIWVSTPELQRRYAASAPRLCEPEFVPATAARTRAAHGGPVYFYHGTGAHRREIEWLVPVVRAVQALVPGARFEIIGGHRVRRMFDGIPRVEVRPPMSWPEYLAYSSALSYQLGLAPCLDSPFNRARSHVKVFDITRLGAAGIYSDLLPYAAKIRHGETGWLCGNSQHDWVRAVSGLLLDATARETMFAGAERWCLREHGVFPDAC